MLDKGKLLDAVKGKMYSGKEAENSDRYELKADEHVNKGGEAKHETTAEEFETMKDPISYIGISKLVTNKHIKECGGWAATEALAALKGGHTGQTTGECLALIGKAMTNPRAVGYYIEDSSEELRLSKVSLLKELIAKLGLRHFHIRKGATDSYLLMYNILRGQYDE